MQILSISVTGAVDVPDGSVLCGPGDTVLRLPCGTLVKFWIAVERLEPEPSEDLTQQQMAELGMGVLEYSESADLILQEEA